MCGYVGVFEFVSFFLEGGEGGDDGCLYRQKLISQGGCTPNGVPIVLSRFWGIITHKKNSYIGLI